MSKKEAQHNPEKRRKGGQMEQKEKILNLLVCLPRKILYLQEQDNLTEFVLHELCSKQCFNIQKGAYFVDNPDFNCLKGIAGYAQSEAFADADIWQNPQSFSKHMQQAGFNQKVRETEQESLWKKGESAAVIVQKIAENLGIENPSFADWQMKHNNHGIFVYQDISTDEVKRNEEFANGFSLLSFCPVY